MAPVAEAQQDRVWKAECAAQASGCAAQSCSIGDGVRDPSLLGLKNAKTPSASKENGKREHDEAAFILHCDWICFLALHRQRVWAADT